MLYFYRHIMEQVITEINKLFSSIGCTEIVHPEKIPQSGSDRVYYRVVTYHFKIKGSGNFIITSNMNIRENRSFILFSRHFHSIGAPVPEIYAENEDGSLYIQQDLGNHSLLNELEQHGTGEYVYGLFQKSLKALAHLQIVGGRELNYDWCITSREFGQQAIMSDLLYFKYYFLDPLKIPYDKEQLLNDFDTFSQFLANADHRHFMFRDFQSRNIMVKDGEVFFIDYQGGMKGALQYDVASLLWQAKAELPDEWKNNLLEEYMHFVEELLEAPLNRERFIGQYHGYVLIRLLQVLGAYGLRGLFERKAHFLTSIPLALRNLKWFLANKNPGISLPLFEELLHRIIEDDVISRFETIKATSDTPLVVKINSFSYLKRGYPPDSTGTGGGYVFDCRGILNPGRLEEYKAITGRDKPVKDFLEHKTRMEEFMTHVYQVVDISVEDYIKRGFENLTVNFGCTGGQHRSVYAADALARHLRNKYAVKIELKHLEQGISETRP